MWYQPTKKVHTSAETSIIFFDSDNNRFYYSTMELMEFLQLQLCVSRDLPNIIFFKGLIEGLIK